jgi:predicted porin
MKTARSDFLLLLPTSKNHLVVSPPTQASSSTLYFCLMRSRAEVFVCCSCTTPRTFAAATVFFVGNAWAADAPILTKAPPVAAAPVTCGSAYDFFFTSCPLTWYGVTFYGTIDVGGGYQTHGAPFNPDIRSGASYLIQKMNRVAMWGLAPNALSQSNIGVKGNEPFAPGWSFVFQLEAGFDAYSLRLANSPGSMASNIGVPLPSQSTNADSSQAGQFYNSVGYLGVRSDTYGTLTVFRQNSLTLDGVLAYDPMGGSYAFSPIGFNGTTCGGGDTEDCRYSTALKYRVNVGPVRVGALWQFGGYQLNNGSNGAGQIQLGGDVKSLGPGTLLLDGIYSYVKDAVQLNLTGGATNAAGMPIAPFPGQVLTATISNNRSVMLLAKYVTGPLKLYAGYEWIQFAPPSDPQTAFTNIAGLPMGAGFANGTAINNVACLTVCSDKILQVVWTGARYTIIPNLDVIGAYYHYSQSTFTNASCASLGSHSQCAGTFDAASAVLDWQFANKFDAYIAFMFSQVNGGLSNGYLARNNIDPTAGVRFKF